MSCRPLPQGFAAIAAVTLLPALCAAGPRPCAPAQIAPDQPDLPAAWQRALDAVVDATAHAGRPWSCSGGEISLTLAETSPPHAILRLRDAQGRTVERKVPTLDALKPIAEALLAAPLPPTDPPSEPASIAPRSDAAPVPDHEHPDPHATSSAQRQRPPGRDAATPPEPSASRAAKDPRILIDGTLGARFGGEPRSLWAAGGVRVIVPIEAWSAGVWARFSLPYVLARVPEDFSMSEVSIGLSVGRRLTRRGPIELTATLDPSIVVVSMEGGEEPDHHDGGKVDLRIGAGIRGAVRWTETWRILAAIDGEISPAGLASPRRIDPMLPPIPSYGVGASLGVEAVIR